MHIIRDSNLGQFILEAELNPMFRISSQSIKTFTFLYSYVDCGLKYLAKMIVY